MEAKKAPEKRIAVRIPDRTYDRAQQYVNDGGAMNISDLIRTALDNKLTEVGY